MPKTIYSPSQPINKKIMHFSALELTSFYIDNNAHTNRAKTQLTLLWILYVYYCYQQQQQKKKKKKEWKPLLN